MVNGIKRESMINSQGRASCRPKMARARTEACVRAPLSPEIFLNGVSQCGFGQGVFF